MYIGCADDLKFCAGRNCVTLALNATGKELWPSFYLRLALFDYFHWSHALRQIPKECLALAWKPTTDEFGANKLEQMLYYNYRQKFAERPPFQHDFSMGKWITTAEERRMSGPLVMPETRYYPI